MNTKVYYRELKAYKYQLHEEFKYETDITGFSVDTAYIKLDKEGILIVSKGYSWDGASGPTIDTMNSMRASLVHDAFYQLMRMGEVSQDQIIPSDKLFKRICIKDGMNSFRAWYWYKGLRLANGAAAKAGTQKPDEVFCAP